MTLKMFFADKDINSGVDSFYFELNKIIKNYVPKLRYIPIEVSKMVF